jgi:putative nucleotidyltransferase with HDIG domain
VYNTVVALVTASTFTRLKTFGGMDLNKLWRHSVISAVAAGAIAKRVDEPQAVAFTAGLLHDIGKLILASVEDSHYAELVRLHGVCHLKLDRAEQEVFGVEHAALGAELLARWGLPDTIVAAVRHHHSASSSVAAPGRLVAIIKLANNLAHFLSIDAAQMCDTTRCNPNALPLLGLTDKELPELIQQIDDGLRHVQGFSKLTFNQFNQSN